MLRLEELLPPLLLLLRRRRRRRLVLLRLLLLLQMVEDLCKRCPRSACSGSCFHERGRPEKVVGVRRSAI